MPAPYSSVAQRPRLTSPFQMMEPLLRKLLKDVATGTFKWRLRRAARNDMLGWNLQNYLSGSRSINKREMMNASAEHCTLRFESRYRYVCRCGAWRSGSVRYQP